MAKFTAQIDSFIAKSKRKLEAVVKQSAQEVFEVAQTPVAMGGNMPVDTGFLRNSLISGVNGVFNLDGYDSYVLAIAGMELGDVMAGHWTANYAVHQEYGSNGREGRFFMRGAAQRWQAIVSMNVERVKNG